MDNEIKFPNEIITSGLIPLKTELTNLLHFRRRWHCPLSLHLLLCFWFSAVSRITILPETDGRNFQTHDGTVELKPQIWF